MGDGCDDHEHAATPDPTRASCCEREREQQEKEYVYKQRLARVDPTSVRMRFAAESVVRNPLDAVGHRSVETESDLDDDSDDEVLEMLRRQRIEELKGSAAAPVETDARLGVELVDESSDDLLRILRQHATGIVLCALIQHEFSRKDDLIECLNAVCVSCPVVVCRLQPLSALPAVLGWQNQTTVVLLLRSDTVVASVAVLESGWRHHDVVASLKQVLGTKHGAEEDDESNKADDAADGRAPCTICGRRYLHTHINTQ